MLNESNLCDLVTALGEEYLCETCDRYPRHVEEYEGLREWSLSLSCPIAAQMILKCEEPLRFVEEEDEAEDPLEDEFEDFDFLLFTQLEDARKILFRMVCDRSKTVEQRMLLLLEMAEEMQRCLDEDRLCDMDELLVFYEQTVGADILDKAGDECGETLTGESLCECEYEKLRRKELQRQFPVFYRMERLRGEWSDVVEEMQELLFADPEVYGKVRRDFLRQYGDGGEAHEQWERYQENLLIFFLYTYFCGAVYDDWIYSKVALAVFSVLFIGEFVMCRWHCADNNSSWQECVELAYCYAREVEHSDNNLNLLEEWLQDNPLALKGTEH